MVTIEANFKHLLVKITEAIGWLNDVEEKIVDYYLSKDSREEQAFRELFGCEEEEIKKDKISSSVALVLPARSLSKSQEIPGDSIQNFTSSKRDGEYKWIEDVDNALRNNNSTAAVKVDIEASNSIASLFSRYNLPSPAIFFDNELIKNKEFLQDSEDIKKLKTFIVIGLYSNRLTCWLHEEDKEDKKETQKYFYLERNDKGKTLSERQSEHEVEFRMKLGGFREENHALSNEGSTRRELSARVDLEKYGPDYKMIDNKDIALFAKLVKGKGDDKKTFIIVGGAGERGTKQLGDYVNKQWQQIYQSIVNQKREKVSHKRQITTSNYSLCKCSFSVAYTIEPNKVNPEHIVCSTIT